LAREFVSSDSINYFDLEDPELLRQSSKSSTGGIETLELGGFNLSEAGAAALPRHWLRDGFPLSNGHKPDFFSSHPKNIPQ